jgi:flavin reductase (DIM6/NTAB) family NADH-FMN oxidoreductase RutF
MNAFVKPPAQSPAQPPAHAPTLTSEAFRRLFRNWIGAVSVIAIGEGAARRGFTATSAAPLAAEPASLMVAVNASGSSFSSFAKGARFSVNLLAAHQAAVAEGFSGRTGLGGVERFSLGHWRQCAGALVLDEALANIVCDVADIVRFESHALILAHIVDANVAEGADALGYWRGAYRSVTRETELRA